MQLLQQAAPRAKAIVSGSYAHGTATAKSDLDFLVVEPGPIARRLESAHPRAILGLIGIPVNIVVITGDIFEEWLSTPGMIALDPACPARPYPVAHFGSGVWRLLGEYESLQRRHSNRQAGGEHRRACAYRSAFFSPPVRRLDGALIVESERQVLAAFANWGRICFMNSRLPAM
jgi:hypothetical protein